MSRIIKRPNIKVRADSVFRMASTMFLDYDARAVWSCIDVLSRHDRPSIGTKYGAVKTICHLDASNHVRVLRCPYSGIPFGRAKGPSAVSAATIMHQHGRAAGAVFANVVGVVALDLEVEHRDALRVRLVSCGNQRFEFAVRTGDLGTDLDIFGIGECLVTHHPKRMFIGGFQRTFRTFTF